jgi:hypothetical protein
MTDEVDDDFDEGDIEQRVWEVLHPASACLLHWLRATPAQRAAIIGVITSDHADTVPPRAAVRTVRHLLAPDKAARHAKSEAERARIQQTIWFERPDGTVLSNVRSKPIPLRLVESSKNKRE